MTRIPVYHRGEWTEQDHPVPEDVAGDGDYTAEMNSGGYAKAAGFFPGLEDYSVAITVWKNGGGVNVQSSKVEGAPGYLLDIELDGSTQTAVGATDIVDLMDLLARWSPVVETAGRLRRRREKEDRAARSEYEALKRRQ